MNLNKRTLQNAPHTIYLWILVAVFAVSSSFAEITFAQNAARRYTSSLSFTEIVQGIDHGQVTSGPQLIKSGRISITHLQEQMSENFATDRHPRTAIGETADGKLLMVTVDGRQPKISVGMSLYSLAQLLLELNATDAINLDGGGSTTMVVKHAILVFCRAK